MTMKVSNDLMQDVLKNIDINAIERNISEGKVDIESLISTLSSLLSKKDLEQLLNNASALANSKADNEHITQEDVAKVLENVTTVKKLQRKVVGGDVDIDVLKKTLENIVGEKESGKLFKQAEKMAEQIVKEENVA